MAINYSLKEAAEIMACDVQALVGDIKNKKLSVEKKKISDKKYEYTIKEKELVRYAKSLGIELVFEEHEEVIEEIKPTETEEKDSPGGNYKTLEEATEILSTDIYTLRNHIKEKKLHGEKRKVSGKRFEYIVKEKELVRYAKEQGLEMAFEEPEEVDAPEPPEEKEAKKDISHSEGKYKSLKEAAELLGSDIYTLKSDIKDGNLVAEKKQLSGKRFEYIVKEEELLRYAKEQGLEMVSEEPEAVVEEVTPPPEEDYKTLKDAAELLGVDIYTLKSDIKDGALTAEKKKTSGKRFEYIIKREELLRYAEEIGVEIELEEPKILPPLTDVEVEIEENLTPEEKIEKYDKLVQDFRRFKKELELANRDFNEQAEEYENLLKDYEKLEEEKFKQDNLISEAEQTILVMVEQYSELAEDTYSRDKKIAELKKEMEDLKKGGTFELSPEDKQKLQDYETLKDDYQLILMEKQRLYMQMQAKNPQFQAINDIHKEVSRLENELKEAREYTKSVEEEKEKLVIRLRESSTQISSVRNIYKEIEKLQGELKTSKEYISTLESQLSDGGAELGASKNYKKLFKKYKKNIQENEDLKVLLEKREEEIKSLKRQMRKKQEDSKTVSVTRQEDSPFPGDFSEFAPLRVIAYLVDNQASGKISFGSPAENGELYVNKGNILHAAYNNWEGDLALAKFLSLSKGAFDFQPDVKTKKLTVRYNSTELLEDFIQNRTDKVDVLIEVADFLVSPDKPLKIKRNWLEADMDIKLKKFQVKILSLISQGKETVNKLSKELNSKQIKVAEAVYFLVKSDLIGLPEGSEA